MPTYDYECLECKGNFEAFQKMSDPVIKACPKCKGKVKRLIGSGFGIIFKGSGFYSTDYKNKNTVSKKTSNPQPPKDSPCAECPSASCSQKEE